MNATETAIALGSHRAANVVLLGALAPALDIPPGVWATTLEQRLPAPILSLNQQAFAAGRQASEGGA